jgi:hypothetical protein
LVGGSGAWGTLVEGVAFDDDDDDDESDGVDVVAVVVVVVVVVVAVVVADAATVDAAGRVDDIVAGFDAVVDGGGALLVVVDKGGVGDSIPLLSPVDMTLNDGKQYATLCDCTCMSLSCRQLLLHPASKLQQTATQPSPHLYTSIHLY